MDPTKCGVPNQIRTRVSAVAEGGLAVALPAAAVAAGDWRLPALDSLLMLFSLSLNYTVSLREAFGRVVRVGRVGGRRMVLWLSHGEPQFAGEANRIPTRWGPLFRIAHRTGVIGAVVNVPGQEACCRRQ